MFNFFLECDFLTLESLKLYSLDVLKAWDYAQTIFYSEELQIAYIKAESYQETSFLIFRRSEGRPAGAFWAGKTVFWARKASRMGLSLGGKIFLSQKVAPQGAFGQNIS